MLIRLSRSTSTVSPGTHRGTPARTSVRLRPLLDLLIPVLGRPWNAQALALSAEATEAPYRLLFLCSPGDSDQIEACRRTGAEVMIVGWPPGAGDFARKINLGFRETECEWVFQGADDIRFSKGWDTEALDVAKETGASVIGTNDLHNPGVLQKAHSTHTLFRRSYIVEKGGTVDGSGTVFCELYDHQFVDNEFCDLAKARGEWAFAEKAVVEHLHPYFGGAVMDETYTKALRKTGADHALYRKRLKLNRRG